MKQTAGDEWRKSIYYHYYEYPGWHSVRKQYGVRTEVHKLIHFYGDDIDDWGMYDLVNDPNELVNLYGMPQFADMQASLKAELHRLQVEYKDTKFVEDQETPAQIYPAEYRESWEKQKINYIMQNMELIDDEEQFLTVWKWTYLVIKTKLK